MVVLVLITSCQVSEYLNTGPNKPQPNIIQNAITKAIGEPVNRITTVENLLNSCDILFIGCLLLADVIIMPFRF